MSKLVIGRYENKYVYEEGETITRPWMSAEIQALLDAVKDYTGALRDIAASETTGSENQKIVKDALERHTDLPWVSG